MNLVYNGFMNPIQQKIIELSQKHDIKNMGLRHIGRLIGVEHPQTIKYHLKKLGLIDGDKKEKPTSKIITLPLSQQKIISIPILGLANCGDATMFAESRMEGNLTLSQKLLPIKNSSSLFAVRAVGSSMNRANIDGKSIEDGDYVIVDSENKNVKTGDYVLSVIGGLANIKKYIEDKNQRQIALISESKQFFPPIYLHEEDLSDYLVSGKVVSVVKETNNDELRYEPI
jgi:SOS-response transcriptional repressor LexA